MVASRHFTRLGGLVFLTLLMCVTLPRARAQGFISQTQLNMPYGVPSLNGSGFITSPIQAPVDNATVNGVALSYIIPQIESIEGKESSLYIPNTLINAPNGVLGLDVNGDISKALILNATLTFQGLSYNTLPPSPIKGTTVFCVDCYSTLRDGTSALTGIMATFNGTSWVDGVGNAIGQDDTTGTTPTPPPLVTIAAEALTSAGATINNALVLSSQYNTVTTVPQGSGVRLPAVVQGQQIMIFNRGLQAMNIYPATATDQIENYGTSQPFTLYPNASVIMVRTATNEWRMK